MRISDILHLGQQYLILGIVFAIIIIGVSCIGYFKVYKKILKGQKQLKASRLLWWAVFICYLTIIAGATLMDRSSYWDYRMIQPLFYSYKDAWINFSVAAWRNIILNICMFIPLGFLLPLGQKFFRKFWKTYFCGFALSVIIESAQLLLKCGVSELDDVMNNTLGTMIGFGLYVLFITIRTPKNKTVNSGLIAVFQIPLSVTIVAFCVIFHSYHKMELGNNPYQYLTKYDKKLLSVTSSKDFSNERKILPVYGLTILSRKEALAFAKQTFKELGTDIDESRNDFYEDAGVFWSIDRYNMWIDYLGGTYSLTDFEQFSEDETSVPQKITSAHEQEIRTALQKYSVKLPESAKFEKTESGSYQFSADMLPNGTSISDGFLTCDYYDNGCIFNLQNSIREYAFYRDFPVISEKEAYERICNGEFPHTSQEALNMEVTDCKISYAIDSKGFYQPVYVFSCKVNSEDEEITIPAIME